MPCATLCVLSRIDGALDAQLRTEEIDCMMLLLLDVVYRPFRVHNLWICRTYALRCIGRAVADQLLCEWCKKDGRTMRSYHLS